MGVPIRKSTVAALLATTYDWFKELESGKGVCSVFFDIRKAFDTVPHRKLIEKLCQLDVSPFVIRWIRSYLTDRHQKVVLGRDESNYHPCHIRVPQGSVLGLLLFCIYIDDVARVPLSMWVQSWCFMRMTCYYTERLTAQRTTQCYNGMLTQ